MAGEAEHQEEILQEAAKVQQEQEEIQQETGLKTEQKEAAKVQQEQETTSDNKQEEETGGRGSHKAGCCFGRGSLYIIYICCKT